MCPIIELYPYCSMKNMVKEYKIEKGLLQKCNMVMYLYHSLVESEIMSVLFKELRQIEVEDGFLWRPCDTLWSP